MELLYDILKTIILSLVSATIFWIFFSYLPKKKRLKKIRPKINQDLESITTSLFGIFRTIFKNSSNINILYNRKVLDGTLKKEDIEIGLINKCYDTNKINNFEYKSYMISIGEDLEKFKFLILKKIEELYFFTEFLSTNELITLEKIKKILNSQNIEIHYKKNLTVLTMHFNDLYKLYIKLNKITFEKNHNYIQTNEFYDIAFPLYQIDYYFYNKKDFKKCKKVSKNYIKNFPSTDIFKLRLIMCEYELNRKNKGLELFKIFIKNKTSLEGYSSIIEIFDNYDERIKPYLKHNMDEDKFQEMNKSIELNKNRKSQETISFAKTNEKLKIYFNN
ncbi:hypothetical protein H4O20_00020 [Aequorivita sp. 609]|uniref:hypothetical protein n=1 Tax=Aequorivita TaxID=153265 RepID=UPI00160F95E0|nr:MULTISPECIES: hypothetical protein [Aequorivita]MBB6679827.1 hypothetical protein [Aequorivita sp. 609]